MKKSPCIDCQKQKEGQKPYPHSKPFVEVQTSEKGVFIRVFPENVPEEMLQWHWDEEDREVRTLEVTDWKFQFDNQLPQEIKMNEIIRIPKGEVHRVIKGSGSLKIELRKL